MPRHTSSSGDSIRWGAEAAPRTALIRNVGVVAHVDAGKTTLTERILHATGRIHALGSVDAGSTVTDSDPRERARGITIAAAAVTLEHRNHAITLIDTPGHVDFSVEVERSLRVLDGAIVVLDAAAGVEPQTESVWRRADERGIPRVVFVNKIDRAGADFSLAVRSIHETLLSKGDSRTTVSVVVPAADGDGLVHLAHRLRIKAGPRSTDVTCPLDEHLAELHAADRERLVEACAAVDDGVCEAYLAGRDVSADDLLRALRRATLGGSVIPIFAGSAKQGLGVTTLLDGVVDLLPAPEPRGDHLAALCFKGTYDGFGQRMFVRVYSGVLHKGDRVMAFNKGRVLRVGRLVRVFGDAAQEIDAVGPGEIGALVGLELASGETLCDPSEPVCLEGLTVPQPVLAMAIEPKTQEDRAKLGPALARLALEDPSLRLTTDPETGQSLLSGLGELHLEVTLEKLRDAHRVSVRASEPQVAYRETITRPVEMEVKHVKQSGGPGQYAHVRIVVEPAPRGSGITFEDRCVGSTVPKTYVPAVEAGIRQGALIGPLGGYPVTDFAVALVGGGTHPNDSSELAFEIAAKTAIEAAIRAAAPLMLEPVMRLEILTPESGLGAVLGDLAARRGRVSELGARGGLHTIAATAPLAELMGYATELRSRTQGRGSASLAFARYDPVPARSVARA
ncbi:MAG: elongation factor G [Polyangiaceae bacterium]